MSKRPRNDEISSSRLPKRPRPETFEKPAIEEIHFARQLQDLLVFRQDGTQQLRNGIASFKAFLESVLYHKEPEDRARQLSILREYLDTQKPVKTGDGEGEGEQFLAPIWQALSFAVHNANDPLTSSLVSLLALLLKTLSAVLDLSEYGLLLCRTVLRGEHLNLLKKCLDAPRHKEFLISPAVRLLAEVVGFDGGVCVREVYKRREQTLGWMWVRKCLGMVKNNIPPEELHRRPAIRTLTVRYILSLLKYLHEGGKADLLQNGALCRALFQNLRDDPPDLVNEILSVTEQHVFKDEELKRSAKAALLNQQNLERVTSIATQVTDENGTASKAFAWLQAVCTKPTYGILRHSAWYPSGTTHLERQRLNNDSIDLGLDSIDFFDRDERPAVRNPILLSWIQTLHPWSNLQERELVLTCFKSAPELVAAYFAEKEKSMQLEPKLSNTWIGYASFLFEVVQLPVPDRFGHGKEWAQLPPQTNIVIESVLPRPLTQKVLSRCLNQSSELITFFAVRILVLGLEKLHKVREQLENGAGASEQHAGLWREASQRLLESFIDQAPPMKDVIGTFRKILDDEEHALQREAIARLLRSYYETMPLQALEEQFDVSNALTAALSRAEDAAEQTQMTELRTLELEHLLQIARHSPGMRWFGKQGGLKYSPITTLLRLHAKAPKDRQMRVLITHVLRSGQAVNGDDIEPLMASLQEPDIQEDIVAWDCLDDCLTRANRKPIKYLDDLGGIFDLEDRSTPSLLCAVFMEQASFLLQRKANQQAMRMVEIFLTQIGDGDLDGGPADVHSGILTERIRRLDGWVDQDLTDGGDGGHLAKLLVQVQIPSDKGHAHTVPEPNGEPEEDHAPAFDPTPVESENHPELFKWAQKDLDMALEDGDISALILCLCSQHADILTQALAQLRKLEDGLINSTLEDKDPIYVLVGELIETYEQNYIQDGQLGRLEYLAAAFATAALEVQMEPSHFMYPKLNRFLNKDPEWRVRKLPTYWIQNTILSTPDSDDEDKAWWLEVRWVLDWIVEGLKTEADLEVLRRSGVFERFMALFSAPGCERGFRERVLELLWRASSVGGEDGGEGGTGKGAEMLVKRYGLLGWLDMVKPSQTGVEGWLRRQVLERLGGDEGRAREVERWAGVRVSEL